MTNPTPSTLANPTLVSAALALLNTQLQTALPWLTTAYGQARRFSKVVDGKTVHYPTIYTGGLGQQDYLPSLFPDEHLATLGGYSWWDVGTVRHSKNTALNSASFEAGLVVWFQFQKVYPSPQDWKAYDVMNVAQEVLSVLVGSIGAASIGDNIQIQDRVEKIYPGLTHDDQTRHFSQMPYGVFRIDVTIDYSDFTC